MSDDETAQLIESLQKRYGLSFLGSEKAMRHFARDWVFLTSPQEPSQGAPLAWLYEDTLPPEYPYDAMYPHSRVDGVRMFPVFGPTADAKLPEFSP